MNRWLEQYFQLSRHHTTVRREFIAGLTTFFTMSYIVAVNPAILKTAGMPPGASLTATILTAIFGTLLMGVYANRPFAIAPYMGENAFIAFTVVHVLGYTWQQALGAVFVAGVLFILMTLFRLRKWMVEAIPPTLRYSYAVGIGLFLTFIGLNQTGIVTIGSPGAPARPLNVARDPARHFRISHHHGPHHLAFPGRHPDRHPRNSCPQLFVSSFTRARCLDQSATGLAASLL